MSTIRIPLCSVGGQSAVLVCSWEADEPQAVLTGYRERLGDRSPLWDGVGTVLREDARQKFSAGGIPAWAPLSERTLREKRRLIRRGAIPHRTPKGGIPRRLKQNGEFTEGTILIRTGKLRDSWVQKGARGHVEELRGEEFFFGSQLTIEKELTPDKPEQHYHILTKKSRRLRARGQAVTVLIPLARLHEEGTKTMPARPVMVGTDGEANLRKETLSALERAALSWATGEEHSP